MHIACMDIPLKPYNLTIQVHCSWSCTIYPCWALQGSSQIGPPVTIRNAIHVFLPIRFLCLVGIVQPNQLPPQFKWLLTMCGVAPPVTIRQAVPVYSAPNVPLYSAPNIPQSSIKKVSSSIPPIEIMCHVSFSG